LQNSHDFSANHCKKVRFSSNFLSPNSKNWYHFASEILNQEHCMSLTVRECVKDYVPTIISAAGVGLTAAQLVSQGITRPYEVLAGVVAGVAAAILGAFVSAEIAEKISGEEDDGFHLWGALSSGVFGVLAPLQARYGFVKTHFNVAHPAFVGFNLGLTGANLFMRVLAVQCNFDDD
jgi:hypothetical protein